MREGGRRTRQGDEEGETEKETRERQDRAGEGEAEMDNRGTEADPLKHRGDTEAENYGDIHSPLSTCPVSGPAHSGDRPVRQDRPPPYPWNWRSQRQKLSPSLMEPEEGAVFSK